MDDGPPRLPVESVGHLEIARIEDSPFTGFAEGAFRILDRLREHPHIEQYHLERERVDLYIKQPFKDYRDAIVMGAVLPNRLNLETERNVFSRLLKNDFGRGGSHHHFWMSFYRPGLTRLRDLQLIHSMHPDAFHVGVSASKVSPSVHRNLKRTIERSPDEFAELIDPFVHNPDWSVVIRFGGEQRELTDRLTPDEWRDQATALHSVRVLRRIPRQEVVVASGRRLVNEALRAMAHVWPLYIHLLPNIK